MYKNNHATICAYNSTNSNYDEIILNDKNFKERNKKFSLEIFQKYEYVYLVGLKQISYRTKSFQKKAVNILKEKKVVIFNKFDNPILIELKVSTSITELFRNVIITV